METAFGSDRDSDWIEAGAVRERECRDKIFERRDGGKRYRRIAKLPIWFMFSCCDEDFHHPIFNFFVLFFGLVFWCGLFFSQIRCFSRKSRLSAIWLTSVRGKKGGESNWRVDWLNLRFFQKKNFTHWLSSGKKGLVEASQASVDDQMSAQNSYKRQWVEIFVISFLKNVEQPSWFLSQMRQQGLAGRGPHFISPSPSGFFDPFSDSSLILSFLGANRATERQIGNWTKQFCHSQQKDCSTDSGFGPRFGTTLLLHHFLVIKNAGKRDTDTAKREWPRQRAQTSSSKNGWGKSTHSHAHEKNGSPLPPC